MARARNIKPGLFRNEVLGTADPMYTLLFQGLWLIADREGRLEYRPLRIKADIFPYRDGLNIESMLQWLEQNGFIRIYSVHGRKLIHICEFTKHQNPHKNEQPSELPPPEEANTNNEQLGSTSEKIGSARADSLNLIPDSGFPLADSANSVADVVSAPPLVTEKPKAGDYTKEFEQAWAAYPKRPGSSKVDAFKAWRARLKEGISADTLIAGVGRYAGYCRAMKTEPQYVKQPVTFFGPAKHFESDWALFAPTPGKSMHSGFEGKDYSNEDF